MPEFDRERIDGLVRRSHQRTDGCFYLGGERAAIRDLEACLSEIDRLTAELERVGNIAIAEAVENERLQAQLHAVRMEYLGTVVTTCLQESGVPPVQIAKAFLTTKEE